MFIDKQLSWGAHIQHVNNRVAKNIGIINKLRYYLDLTTMRQLYYTLIFPYLNYGILSWGNNYKTRWNKLRTKQNKCACNIFFAHSREHSTPYYIHLFRERLPEKVLVTIPKGIMGGFEWTVLQRNLEEWHGMFAMLCLRLLKESNKSRFDSYSR